MATPPDAAIDSTSIAATLIKSNRSFMLLQRQFRGSDLIARPCQSVARSAIVSIYATMTKVRVDGYTAVLNTAAYNQKLSVHRAQNVQAALVRNGVLHGEIAIQVYGQSDLRVPTAKGVRGSQIRRVEIILKQVCLFANKLKKKASRCCLGTRREKCCFRNGIEVNRCSMLKTVVTQRPSCN